MVAELAVVWAVALHLAILGAALYAVALSVAAHLAVVYVEEPGMRQRFGESYVACCSPVPRWLPRPGRRT